MATKAYKKNARIFLILLSGLFLMTGCESACTRTKKNDTNKDEVAAVINGVNIPAAALNTSHHRTVNQFKLTGRAVSEDLNKSLRSGILRKMLDDEIIRQHAEKEKVKVDRIERVNALEKYKEKMGGPKGFQVFLERQNLTEDHIMHTLVNELQRDKLIQKLGSIEEPTEQEVLSHYKTHEKVYMQQEMVRARHILLKLDAKEPTEKADLVLKKAQQILAEAHKEGASFTDLVQKYSEGPSVKTGGDLGFFSRGRMAKEFEDVAFSAPLKKAVGPVRTDFGYHIIFVEEKSEEKTAKLEEVRDRIVEVIKRNKRARKTEELLAALRKSAKIVINDKSLTHEEYKQESERTAEKTAKQEN